MTPAATVRAVAPADLGRWAQMRHELWPQISREHHLEELKGVLDEPDVGSFVAEAGGALLGFIELALRPYANGCESRPIAFVEGIWVGPGQRRQGIGRLLIAAAEAWARSKGGHELGSDTELFNAPSQAAHAAWGFTETERVVYFRKTL